MVNITNMEGYVALTEEEIESIRSTEYQKGYSEGYRKAAQESAKKASPKSKIKTENKVVEYREG